MCAGLDEHPLDLPQMFLQSTKRQFLISLKLPTGNKGPTLDKFGCNQLMNQTCTMIDLLG
jgi:hypothetical protein